MTDILSNISSRLILLGAEVTGIRRAVDPPAPSLDSGDLPAMWIFTDPATHAEGEIDEETTSSVRMFRLQVAVLTLGEGDPHTRESRCRPLLDLVLKKFRGVPSLRNLAFINLASVVGDSGIVILPEYGSRFIGFEIRIRVRYYEPRNFEPGE